MRRGSALLLGVMLGFSWPLHQWLLFGDVALQQHFLGQVLEPSTQPVGIVSRLIGYPLILLRSYQPILFPGLAGAVMLAMSQRARRRAEGEDWRRLLLVAWIVVPVAIASLSSAQSSRYIFSILTPLALCAAWWLLRVLPRVAAFITHWFTPALATAAAIAFWVQPTLLTRDQNQIFKSQAERSEARHPRRHDRRLSRHALLADRESAALLHRSHAHAARRARRSCATSHGRSRSCSWIRIARMR